MPLGLLARDSIQDLTQLGREDDDDGKDANTTNGKNSAGTSSASKLKNHAFPTFPGMVASVNISDDHDQHGRTAAGDASTYSDANKSTSTNGGGGGGGTSPHQQFFDDNSTIHSGASSPDPGTQHQQHHNNANPQQAQEVDEDVTYARRQQRQAPPPPGGGGAYAGFRTDYHTGYGHGSQQQRQNQQQQQHSDDDYTRGLNAFSYYDMYETTPTIEYLAERKSESRGGFLNCIFPCFFGGGTSSSKEQDRQQQQEEDRLEQERLQINAAAAPPAAATVSIDTNSVDYYAATSTASTGSTTSPDHHQHQDKYGLPRPHSREEDEVSTNSDLLGEKLSDRERQAVLARLGLAQPDADEQQQEQDAQGGGGGGDSAVAGGGGGGGGDAAKDDADANRRSLVPDANGSSDQDQSHPKDRNKRDNSAGDVAPSAPLRSTSEHSKKKSYHHPKGGLLNGIPTYDSSPLEQEEEAPKPVRGILKRGSTLNIGAGGVAKDVSQQHAGSGESARNRRSLFPSYSKEPKKKRAENLRVNFSPMARVVTVKSKNDMDAEEKADVWWQKSDYEDFRKTGRIITKAMLEGGSEIWLHAAMSNDYDGAASSDEEGPNDKDTKDGYKAPGDKWWHRFGHSRRGLEHVVSIDEGRQRQQNVRNAIHAVLEEQLRQKRYHREDPDKLRIVSLNHTSWARDLALAAGASDADAVETSFAKDRKTREFYLLKIARTTPSLAPQTSRRVPEFMKPALAMANVASPKLTGHKLDANTASQIAFRRDLMKGNAAVPKSQSQDAANASKNGKETAPHNEPIHDPADKKSNSGDGHDQQKSLAQLAKGFMSSEDSENVDMAAVLSGMGVIRQEKPTAVAS